MFNKQLTETYKNILPPQNLRQEIINKCNGLSINSRSGKTAFFPKALKYTSAAAACFMAVIALYLGFIRKSSSVDIYLQGVPFTESAVVSSPNARAFSLSAPLVADFEIRSENPIEISVSDGNIITYNSESFETVFHEKTYSGEKEASFTWMIEEPDTNTTYNMSVNSTRIFLIYDDALQTWRAEKE